MNLPRITLAKVEALTDLNRIGHALDLGTGYFTGLALCAIDPNATWETPPTHYAGHDQHAQSSEQEMWQGMAQAADLPELPYGRLWGEDGIISSLDAQNALAFGNLKIVTAAGEDDPAAWFEGTLLGWGLQRVPSEP